MSTACRVLQKSKLRHDVTQKIEGANKHKVGDYGEEAVGSGLLLGFFAIMLKLTHQGWSGGAQMVGSLVAAQPSTCRFLDGPSGTQICGYFLKLGTAYS